MDFLEFEYPNEIKISSATLLSIKSSVRKIGKSLKSKSKAKLQKKHEENLEVMPSVKDIQKYEKSKEREKIKRLINEFDDQAGKKVPSRQDVSSILGYFFIEQCLNNGCRTGEITNLTMDHFKKRIQFPNGYFVLKVSDHKTAHTYSSSCVNVPPDLFKEMVVYLKYIRIKLVSRTHNPYLYLKNNGTKHNSSSVIDYIGSIWRLLNTKSIFTPTMIRFTMSTRFKNEPRWIQRELALKMTHTPKVHDERYIHHKMDLANETVMVAQRQMMRGKPINIMKTCKAPPTHGLYLSQLY